MIKFAALLFLYLTKMKQGIKTGSTYPMHRVTRTHNAYHLGDNLVHLNFMRRVAQANPNRAFVHFTQWRYTQKFGRSQITDLIQDVPNLSLADFNYHLPSDSIEAWRGAQGPCCWYNHPDKYDFVKFHLEAWFPYLCDRMDVDNPIKSPRDMLFDYPIMNHCILPDEFSDPFDVLFINSPPESGQFRGYDEFLLGQIAIQIGNKGFKVISTAEIPDSGIRCTANVGMTVTSIGRLSLNCDTIVMISTGPSWTTFNRWNQESVSNRIIMLDPERVNLSPHTFHCASAPEASEVLREIGLL